MEMTLDQFLSGEKDKGYRIPVQKAQQMGRGGMDVQNVFVQTENAKRPAPQQLQSDPQRPQTYGQFLGVEHAKEKNSAQQRQKTMPISIVLNVEDAGMKQMTPGPEVRIESVSFVSSDGPFDLIVGYNQQIYAQTSSEKWRDNRRLQFAAPLHLPKNQPMNLYLRNRHNGRNQVQMIFEGVSQWR